LVVVEQRILDHLGLRCQWKAKIVFNGSFKVTAPGGIFRLVADQIFSLVALKEILPLDIL